MKSSIILALTTTTVAMPFSNILDVKFSTNSEPRHIPPPDQMPGFHPIGTGSGTGFPCATMTGTLPTGGGGGMHALPHGPRPGSGVHHRSRALAIDYQLAPTAAPAVGLVIKRQQQDANATTLPSFTLLDPSDTPGVSVPVPTTTRESESEAPSPSPTEDPDSPFPFPFPFPTGYPNSPFPTALPAFPFPFPNPGFPGTGIPSLPTTLATRTRRPHPTAQPEAPGFPGEEQGESRPGVGQSLWDWLEGLLGKKGDE